MYILTNKETEKITVVAEKNYLANLLSVSWSTIHRRFERSNVYENEKYHIREADNYIPPTKKTGNRLSWADKKANNG